jgi:hypothetical protein
MNCHLCGAKNPDSAIECYLCNSKLLQEENLEVKPTQEVFLESEDISQNKISKAKLFAIATVLLAIALPWFFMLDLFLSPSEIVFSRRAFNEVKASYLKDSEKFDTLKDEILKTMQRHRLDSEIAKQKLEFNELPSEIALSYFLEDLFFATKNFEDVCIYPIQSHPSIKLILSKYERNYFPVGILLSLEIEISSDENKTEAKFGPLLRGSREIPNSLAWYYFSDELQRLRIMETFTGGIQNLSLSDRNQDSNNKQFNISWKYSHSAIKPNATL